MADRYKGGAARSQVKPIDVDMCVNRHLYDSPKTLIAKGQLVVIPMWDLEEVARWAGRARRS